MSLGAGVDVEGDDSALAVVSDPDDRGRNLVTVPAEGGEIVDGLLAQLSPIRAMMDFKLVGCIAEPATLVVPGQGESPFLAPERRKDILLIGHSPVAAFINPAISVTFAARTSREIETANIT